MTLYLSFFFFCFTHFHLEFDCFLKDLYQCFIFYQANVSYFFILQSHFLPLQPFPKTFSPHFILFANISLLKVYFYSLFPNVSVSHLCICLGFLLLFNHFQSISFTPTFSILRHFIVDGFYSRFHYRCRGNCRKATYSNH